MKKVNILLVDDREEGLISLEAVLKNAEYNLMKAHSGQEALAHVLVNDFAVILMDVQMPEMDGFETTAIIKQRHKSRNIPIIFMTADNKADHYISEGYAVGAVDYVLKPFDPYILRSKVSVFVDLYKKTQLLREQNDFLQEVERRDRLRVLHDLEVEGRRRYQNLADAIPQIIFRASQEGLVEYFNQYWVAYTGRPVETSVGDHWKEAVHPKDISLIDAKWATAQTSQQGFEVECRLLQNTQSEYRWHLLRIVPEFGKQLNLVSWIGVAADIHDQKMFQQELLRAKKMAEVASETKSNFLANMSHEIRTPLGIILGFSELLIDAETSDKEKAESILAIRRNGEQLSKIIDEILDLSKVEAGRMNTDKSEVEMIDLLNAVRAFMALPAKEKGIGLKFQIKNKIPKTIQTNSTRLQQILVNLVGNAIKFTSQGDVTITTSFDMVDSRPVMKFNVKDSGPGLTQNQIENLFQPFTQVDTSMTRKYGGTGLGLALSRKLARALGGDITVEESPPGEGCDFQISVSAEYPKDTIFVSEFDSDLYTENHPENEIIPPTAEIAPLSAAATNGAKPQVLKNVNILLVEDSLENQLVISRFLTIAGAHVEVANNGIEGVDKAMQGEHDVVLMDIQMPELDGYGAISQLRRNGYEKPIIALTAHGMVEDRQKSIDVGSNSHLTKPVNRKVLIEKLQSFITKH